MRAVIQRVKHAEVSFGSEKRTIGEGLLIFLGIEHEDRMEDAEWLAAKIGRLRIFNDENGVMNLDVVQSRGDIMVISQFTLHAKTRKGNRPSYIKAAPPEIAVPLYGSFIDAVGSETGIQVKRGEFGAKMEVSLLNDGPVTILIDTKNKE